VAKEPRETNKSATIKCDLYNPCRGIRVTYDGIEGSQAHISVAPGETKRGVTIARWIAEELRDQNRRKKDSTLVIKPMSGEPAEPSEDDETGESGSSERAAGTAH
jgi:hypothetical protein